MGTWNAPVAGVDWRRRNGWVCSGRNATITGINKLNEVLGSGTGPGYPVSGDSTARHSSFQSQHQQPAEPDHSERAARRAAGTTSNRSPSTTREGSCCRSAHSAGRTIPRCRLVGGVPCSDALQVPALGSGDTGPCGRHHFRIGLAGPSAVDLECDRRISPSERRRSGFRQAERWKPLPAIRLHRRLARAPGEGVDAPLPPSMEVRSATRDRWRPTRPARSPPSARNQSVRHQEGQPRARDPGIRVDRPAREERQHQAQHDPAAREHQPEHEPRRPVGEDDRVLAPRGGRRPGRRRRRAGSGPAGRRRSPTSPGRRCRPGRDTRASPHRPRPRPARGGPRRSAPCPDDRAADGSGCDGSSTTTRSRSWFARGGPGGPRACRSSAA